MWYSDIGQYFLRYLECGFLLKILLTAFHRFSVFVCFGNGLKLDLKQHEDSRILYASLIVISVSFSRNVTHRGVVSGRYRVLSSRRYIIPKSNHHLTFGTVDEFSWIFLEGLINFSTLSLKGRGNISVIIK